jgi:hypothetical protein
MLLVRLLHCKQLSIVPLALVLEMLDLTTNICLLAFLQLLHVVQHQLLPSVVPLVLVDVPVSVASTAPTFQVVVADSMHQGKVAHVSHSVPYTTCGLAAPRQVCTAAALQSM